VDSFLNRLKGEAKGACKGSFEHFFKSDPLLSAQYQEVFDEVVINLNMDAKNAYFDGLDPTDKTIRYVAAKARVLYTDEFPEFLPQ